MTFAKARRAVAALMIAASIAAPVSAQSPSPTQSLAQDLSTCAGAVAAVGHLSVLEPQTNAAGEWATVLGAILARLNHEPGVEGMTGRVAADAARLFWAERPQAERERQANQCRTRFGAG